ncbi:pro-glucagon-like [Colius striatus]|uniref:pro-glucagon-like n=1 Tax=Colius striatus TaxID=57412 RepID=UPI000529CC60|nr:pro-glucagon-like [Colius striatus]
MQLRCWLYLSGLVVAVLIPAGWQMGPKDLDDSSRWQPYEPQGTPSFGSNIKRHSEGTFTSDFTRYLDKMKAKDFVHWLINAKRYRGKGEMGTRPRWEITSHCTTSSHPHP